MGMIFSAAPSWSMEESGASASGEVSYGTGVGRKLSRGLGNLAFGWMDILKGVEEQSDQHNLIAAITYGPIIGTSHAVGRTLAGAYEVVTFPIKTSENFEPIVQPEFVVAHDEAGERSKSR